MKVSWECAAALGIIEWFIHPLGPASSSRRGPCRALPAGPTEAPTMRAIKEARKFIERNPTDAAALTLSRLVLALEKEADFPLTDLYSRLDHDQFALALRVLDEWRLDRYYLGKARLFEVSMLTHGMAQETAAAPAAAPAAEAPAAEDKPAKKS